MKQKIQLTLFVVFGLFPAIFAQVSTSKWQTEPIVIDGDGSDWGTLPRFFNAESNIKYEFRNDTRNLYVILKAADRATQIQLVRAGFSVKLKVKTTPPIKTSINFPALKMSEMPTLVNNQEGRTDKLVDKTLTQPEFMPKDTAILDGFQFSKGIITSDRTEENGICFARSKSNRELTTYEIQIPLRELFGDKYKLSDVAGTPIQLQVMINDLSQNTIKKMKGRMGGGMHGGERGGRGGGRGMGGMNGGREMGGEMAGAEMGEMPGGEMGGGEMQSRMPAGFSMERKSFSIDFKLSAGK